MKSASCVPEACESSADCDQGEICNEGSCEASCSCTDDQQAIDAGFAYCDETRGTCETTPVGGSCQGASTCTTAEPTCPAGQVALIANDCYTGTCGDIATCDLTPECEKLQAEGDCLGRSAQCTSVYYGVNCTNPNSGAACQAGDSGCVCEFFQFADCRTRLSNASPFTYEGPNGELVDMFSSN
jgi:hypothetical protein